MTWYVYVVLYRQQYYEYSTDSKWKCEACDGVATTSMQAHACVRKVDRGDCGVADECARQGERARPSVVHPRASSEEAHALVGATPALYLRAAALGEGVGVAPISELSPYFDVTLGIEGDAREPPVA